MQKYLNAQEIEQAQDIPFEDVDVPEWGGWERVLGLNGEAAQDYVNKLVTIGENGQVKNINSATMMIDLLSLSLADDQNNLQFNSEKGKQILRRKSAAVLTRLFEVAQRLSGIGPQAEASALKNSEGMPDAALPSA